MQTVDGAADAKADAGQDDAVSTVREKPLKSKGTDGADAKDAKCPSQSGPEKKGQRGWRGKL